MKTKLFIIAAAMELRLADGQIFSNNKNETKEAFIKRIGEETLEELEVTEVTSKSLEKFKTPQLLDAHKKEDPKSVYGRMLETVLSSRGVAVEKTATAASKTEDPAKAEAKAKAAEDKAAAAKEKADAKEAREKAKAEAKELKAKAAAEKKAAKVERVPFAGYSDEEIANAKASIGHVCTFNPFPVDGREALVEGVIKGIVTDKRVGRTYFRAYDSAGVLYYVQITNKTLKIGEVAPEDPKKAEAKAAKEAAAKAKAEAKENAAKAKAEAVEAKAKAKAEAAQKKADETKAKEEAKAKASDAKALPAEAIPKDEVGKGINKTAKKS